MDKNRKHKAILINGTPKDVALTFDRNDHLIQMPLVAKARFATMDFVGVISLKLLSSFTHRLMGGDDP
jgi:hypothetical protein